MEIWETEVEGGERDLHLCPSFFNLLKYVLPSPPQNKQYNLNQEGKTKQTLKNP